MTLAAALLAAALTAAPPRTPAEQARLTGLAQALGRVHALHRLCAGESDDLWRSRMGRLLQIETPDAAFRQRLTDSFNAGFAAAGGAYKACSLDSRAALTEAQRAAASAARELAGPSATP